MHIVLSNKTTCPACHAEITVKDLSAKTVKCEFCDTEFPLASKSQGQSSVAALKDNPDQVPSGGVKPDGLDRPMSRKPRPDRVDDGAVAAQEEPVKAVKDATKVEVPLKPSETSRVEMAAKAERGNFPAQNGNAGVGTQKDAAVEKPKGKKNTSGTMGGSVEVPTASTAPGETGLRQHGSHPMATMQQDDLSKVGAEIDLDEDIDLTITDDDTPDSNAKRIGMESEAVYAKRIRDFRKIGEDATAYMTALDFADEYPGSFNAWRFLFEMESSPSQRRNHLDKMIILAADERESSYLREKAPLVLRKDQSKAVSQLESTETEIESLKAERSHLMNGHALMKPEEWRKSIESELSANIRTMKEVKPQLEELQSKQGGNSNPHVYLFMALGAVLGGLIGFLVSSQPASVFIGVIVGFVVGVIACLMFSVMFSVSHSNKVSAQIAAVQDYMEKLDEKEADLLDQQRQCKRVFDIAEEIDALQSDAEDLGDEVSEIEQYLEKIGI